MGVFSSPWRLLWASAFQYVTWLHQELDLTSAFNMFFWYEKYWETRHGSRHTVSISLSSDVGLDLSVTWKQIIHLAFMCHVLWCAALPNITVLGRRGDGTSQVLMFRCDNHQTMHLDFMSLPLWPKIKRRKAEDTWSVRKTKNTHTKGLNTMVRPLTCHAFKMNTIYAVLWVC